MAASPLQAGNAGRHRVLVWQITIFNVGGKSHPPSRKRQQRLKAVTKISSRCRTCENKTESDRQLVLLELFGNLDSLGGTLGVANKMLSG